jgi:hypothetical protein
MAESEEITSGTDPKNGMSTSAQPEVREVPATVEEEEEESEAPLDDRDELRETVKRQSRQIERLKRRIGSRPKVQPEQTREVPVEVTKAPARKVGAISRFNRVLRPWKER